jgi:methylglutaconyl-CoA hydratase
MTFTHLAVRREGPVEHVVLNRPEVRNAFNEALIADLTGWAEAVRRDAGVRVAVLSGAGKVFSAGADLTWMSKAIAYTREENLQDASAMAQMFDSLNTLPIPLVGRIHGAALGGGTGLAAVCDMVAASDETVFGFTEVKLGILPAVISPFVLAKIGLSAARELFLTGARFTAQRAREIGLVHAVAPPADLDATVAAWVDEILTSAPTGVAAAKALIPRVLRMETGEARALTTATIAGQRVSPEGQEGMRAFLEKRRPGWIVP